MGRLVEKKHSMVKDAVSLMLLGKYLLFKTLGFQIADDFVWKSQARYHSFNLNLIVKLLYLII